jgi:ribonuclease HI
MEHGKLVNEDKRVIPTVGIAVDCGSVNGKNPGIFEYRLVDIATKRIILNRTIAGITTNNIAEFIALSEGLKLTYDNPSMPVYSDSLTAISWVNKLKIKTTFTIDNQEQRQQIINSLIFLRNNPHNKPQFWNHKIFPNNPADYNRK